MTGDLVATYRLQLQPGFGFREAANVIPYLERLGVSHVYLSPVFRSRARSRHGYDVVDPTRLNTELGSDDDFGELIAACARRGMGVILDIVPNHMAATYENPWWRDVMERGPASRFASFFEIDWANGHGRLVLPVLGRTYEEALAAGELQIGRDGETPVLRYFQQTFALAASSLPATDLVRGMSDAPHAAIDAVIRRQHYSLVRWREAPRAVNYRRFFDINDLAALRMDDDALFDATHTLLARLIAVDGIAGVRVDHVDGLRDPLRYLRRLRELVGPNRYIWVEKILGEYERLPSEWPVQGTTGYEAQAVVDHVLASSRGIGTLGERYSRFAGPQPSFPEVVVEAKLEVVRTLFAGEFYSLAQMLAGLAADRAPDVDDEQWAEALALMTAGLPCYRTYIDDRGASEQDAAVLEQAATVARARGANETAVEAFVSMLLSAPGNEQVLAFARRWQLFSGPVAAKGLEDRALYRDRLLLSLDAVGRTPTEDLDPISVGRFHAAMTERLAILPLGLSTSSTHDSKRSEDVRLRISAISEMPRAWARMVGQWHAMNAGLRAHTSHDVPDRTVEWAFYQTLAGTWPGLDGLDEEYLARLQRYIVKAEREAGLHTSWFEVEEDYESAISAWVAEVVSPGNGEFLRSFDRMARRIGWHGALNSLTATLLKIACPGVPDFYQGHEREALRLVDPDNRGIVEFGPLDASLDSMTGGVGRGWWGSALRNGTAKQRLIRDALAVRRALPELFLQGRYEPLEVRGPRARNVIAFARVTDADAALVVVPRFTVGLFRPDQLPGESRWNETTIAIPDYGIARFRNAVGAATEVAVVDGQLRVADALGEAPVALLVALE